MENETRLLELFNIPRMGHVWDGSLPIMPRSNCVKGIHDMIKSRFKPEFEIVEVGSFQGASTMLFSHCVSKVYSVDCYDYPVPPTGRIPSHDQTFIDAENIFLERMVKMPNVVKIKKHSVEAALDFLDHSVDAVYIDAEHDFQNVQTDINTWKGKIKSGGILCGHDWSLGFIEQILLNANIFNDLEVYEDDSWSVIIK